MREPNRRRRQGFFDLKLALKRRDSGEMGAAKPGHPSTQPDHPALHRQVAPPLAGRCVPQVDRCREFRGELEVLQSRFRDYTLPLAARAALEEA